VYPKATSLGMRDIDTTRSESKRILNFFSINFLQVHSYITFTPLVFCFKLSENNSEYIYSHTSVVSTRLSSDIGQVWVATATKYQALTWCFNIRYVVSNGCYTSVF
jgi:hypothetical protein